MKRLKEIDCSREETKRLLKEHGRYNLIPAEYGGWLVPDVVQVLFLKVVELEERIEKMENVQK